jgi:hypothetical protein
MANSLAISASNFRVPLPPKLRYDVEVKYRPSILEKIKHWKVFEYYLEIKMFSEIIDEFFALHIDQELDSEIDPCADLFLNKIVDHYIVKFPINHIPKGLFPLERLFYINDVAVKIKISGEDANVAECNIGTEKNPKFVKMSSSFSKEQRAEYVDMLREFVDVFV